MKYKEHRVGVFVDVQNIYYSAKNLYGRYPDYGKILEKIVEKRKLICAFAYAVRAYLPKQDDFFLAFGKCWF